MNESVARIGGIVRPEPDPETQLSRLADDLGDDEFAEWMDDYRAGRWLLACVQMFADVLTDDGVSRVYDGGVRPLTLGVPHDESNLAQAREAVAQYVDELASSLNDDDVDTDAEELEQLPIHIELDPALRAQLSV